MAKTPDEIFTEKMRFIAQAQARLSGSVIAMQNSVFELLATEYFSKMEIVDGLIANTAANDALLYSLDKVFDKLEKGLLRDVLGSFATDLLQSASMSAEYYEGLGFQKSVIDTLLRDKVRLESKLGITSSGRLKKDGYLHRLGKTEGARQQLKTYVLKSLTGDVAFLDFQLGFRNLVLGNKRVKGVATTGSLERYFSQFAYDAFNDLDAMANKQLASNLGLQHFIYEGSLIDTSRAFCKKRAGKAFTVAETKKWKNDPDLIDKKTKESYNPLIDRGRYRCRHFIKYITKTVYAHIMAT